MRLENLLIPVVIFSLVISTGIFLFDDQIDNYDIDADTSSFDAVDDFDDRYQAEEERLRDNTQGGEVSEDDTEGSLIKSGYPGILGIFSAVPLAGDIMTKTAKETQLVQPFVVQALMAIIGILAGAFMIYMIFRFQPQK